MDVSFLNVALMRHWENWVYITLMILISLMAVDIFVTAFSSNQSPTETA